MRKLMTVALCATLCGCVTASDQPLPPNANLSFDDGRRLVATERGRIWKDPESIRSAAIGAPYACTGGLSHIADMPNVCLCVEANARNSFGGYTGVRQTEVLIKDRRVVDVMSPPRGYGLSCGPLTPFPELEGGATPIPVPQAQIRPKGT